LRPTNRLSPAEGYRRWAPTYAAETVVSALEERVVGDLLPDLHGRRLLDAGCGIGRRVRAVAGRPALAVGLDLVPDMLLAGAGEDAGLRVAGDVGRLPFADRTFDLVWCRLVLGHVADLIGPYREMARVARRPAGLVVSDFHARAVAAGHRRSFRDANGSLHEIEHHLHDEGRHVEAAASAGWTLVKAVDAPAGAPERAFYERAGRLTQYEREAELPLVLVMSFAR
jgi:SAM-dependent methyltransferase